MNRSSLAEAGKARSYLSRLSQTIDALDTDAFDHAIGLVRTAWQNGKQIIVIGNGGSALTAQHYVTDLEQGNLSENRTAVSRRLFG